MNYIFLDIDGVLNSRNRTEVIVDGAKGLSVQELNDLVSLDENAVRHLAAICEHNDARVVLSSSWRLGLTDKLEPTSHHLELLLDLFNKYNIKLVGKTINYYCDRGLQIQIYIRKHFSADDQYIVIDDDDWDIKDYIPPERLIITDNAVGLLEKHILLADQKF